MTNVSGSIQFHLLNFTIMKASEISLRHLSLSALALVCSLTFISCSKENVQPTLDNGNDAETVYARKAPVRTFSPKVDINLSHSADVKPIPTSIVDEINPRDYTTLPERESALDEIKVDAVGPRRSATEYSSINFQRLHRGSRFHPRSFNPKEDRSIRITMNRIDSPM